MTLHQDTIVTDPRFESDPVALFDELVARHGYKETSQAWSAACNLVDRAAEEARR